MDMHEQRQKLWKLLTNPGIELVATIVVVMVATWYLIESGSVDAFPVFGRR
jgi:hypothetical protein